MKNPPVQRLHPLTAAAAVAVILVCLLGVALMTGVMPQLTDKARTPFVQPGSPAPALQPIAGAVKDDAPTVSDSLGPGEATVSDAPGTVSGASSDGRTASGGPGTVAGVPVARSAVVADSGLIPTGTAPQPAKTVPAPAVPVPEDRSPSHAVTGRPAVYVHVLDEATRRQIQELGPVLAMRGITLAGIKVVAAGPGVSDMRYFRAEEREEALTVRKILLSLGLPAQRLKRIGGFEPVATPHQFEIWLATDYRTRSASAAGP